MFRIRMGVPEMEQHWTDLSRHAQAGTFNKQDAAFFKKWVQALDHLRHDPRHPGLRTHEIGPLSTRYGMKVWQSYLENRKRASRMFWVYGPGKKEITILGIEPHPEDNKRGAYNRLNLDQLPPEERMDSI